MAQGRSPPSGSYDVEAAAWLYAHSGDGFALVENGRIVSANPAWCAMHGYALDEVIGQHALKTIHPDDRQIYFDAAARLQADGEMTMEHRVCTGDGQVVWARLAVKTAQDGLSMVVMKDVTAERLQKREQEHARHIGELLSASAGVSLWTFDPDTRAFTVESSGEGPDEAAGSPITGGPIRERIHPDDLAGFDAAFLPSVQTGQAAQHTFRHWVTACDGAAHWARFQTAWRGMRQRASGRWELRGLTQDITEIADARDAALRGERAAKDAAETKANFLANMSHEIRTPLNGVLGVLHLLKGEALSDDGRERVEQALGCGGMLTELLNDVLDVSSLEAGGLELKPEPVDVAAALAGVAGMLRADAEAKGLDLLTVITGEPGWVSIDPVRLRQMLFNLIGNAIKFTPTGRVEVRLACIGAGAEHRLRVEVEDTGVGVAPEAMDALFERFQQADGSATRRFGGAGLGLAITRGLARRMGGDVEATSELGRGSTFRLDIPAPAADFTASSANDEASWLEGLRILVVEDNPTNQMIARQMLEGLGAAVETADNGALGVEAVARQAFDLVFMDIQMPVMGGVEACRRIRASTALAQIPILAVTANVMDYQLAEYRAVGMNGVIAKPLSPAAIVAEIARLAAEGQDDVETSGPAARNAAA
jgi:PAS domain S-box-containing protein